MKPSFLPHRKSLISPSSRWLIWAAMIAALMLSSVMLYYGFRFRRSTAVADSTASEGQRQAIASLGYLQPEGEVIALSAPVSSNGMGSRVAQLLVEEGEWVEEGEVIALLDNVESLRAAVTQAEKRVEVARANLARVQAGARTGELEAQRAAIARLRAEQLGELSAQDQILTRLTAELRTAEREYARYQMLYEEGATTASLMDSKHLSLITAQEQWNEAQVYRSQLEASFQEQINAAQATFNQLAEVRPTDLQAAQAEVQSAIADVTRAKADLNLAYVRAPFAGQILKIHTRPGEVVGDRGIVSLGQTDQMNVIAEVYELDVSQVRVGQPATITSEAFSEPLQGEVIQVGFQVRSQNVISTDPVADVDQRVIEVKIRLNPQDSRQVASLTNLQVNVVIDLHQID